MTFIFLKKIVKGLFRFFRFSISKVDLNRKTLSSLCKYLIKRGFLPSTVIDVGLADETIDLYGAFPNAQMILLELIEEYYLILERLIAKHNRVLVRVAATDFNGESRFMCTYPHMRAL